MVPWLGEVKAEGIWQPMNNEFEAEIPEAMPLGKEPMKPLKMKFKGNTYSVGTIWLNSDDAQKHGDSGRRSSYPGESPGKIHQREGRSSPEGSGPA